MSKTTPVLGVICHFFGKNLRALASAIPKIWMGPPNLQETLLLQRDRATHLSVEILQLQNIPIVWNYLRDPAFSRFYTIPECDRHTRKERRMDRYTTTACTTLA